LTKLAKIFGLSSIISFFISSIVIIVIACTKVGNYSKLDIVVAWICFILIIISVLLVIAAIVLAIIDNKDEFKKIYNKVK